MLVSRSTSASIHSFISSSRVAGVLALVGQRLPDFDGLADRARALAAAMAPPIDTRSFISVVSDTRQPSPGLPSISASGMRASVKYTSLNSASPVIWRSGRTSTPGAVHVDDERGEPGVLDGLGIGAHDEQAPAGDVGRAWSTPSGR